MEEPNLTNESEITEDLEKEAKESIPDRLLTVPLGGVEYKVSFSDKQWVQLQTIILPKPVPGDADHAQITADHIWSVNNVGDFLINDLVVALRDHDKRKLKQTLEQHHEEEPHHWPLDGYKNENASMLPVEYVAEAVADYIATVFGRAFAGRPLDWMSPTNPITAGDVLTSTVLAWLQRNELATISPELKIPGCSDD